MANKKAKVNDELAGNGLSPDLVIVDEAIPESLVPESLVPESLEKSNDEVSDEQIIDDNSNLINDEVDSTAEGNTEEDLTEEESITNLTETLGRELTEEDYLRYKELISHAYKNTNDENLIKERLILANTILTNKFCDILNSDDLGIYTDISTLHIQN